MNRAERRKAGFTGKKEALDIKMQNKGDQVVIEFGVPLKWFAMGVPEADEFLKKLQGQVDQLKIQALSHERSH